MMDGSGNVKASLAAAIFWNPFLHYGWIEPDVFCRGLTSSLKGQKMFQ